MWIFIPDLYKSRFKFLKDFQVAASWQMNKHFQTQVQKLIRFQVLTTYSFSHAPLSGEKVLSPGSLSSEAFKSPSKSLYFECFIYQKTIIDPVNTMWK